MKTNDELIITFPEFITHVTVSKNKWKKIGYNAIYMCPHFHVRNSFTSAIHTYIEKYMPKNLKIEGPVTTEVIIYVPINYGNVKSVMDKKLGVRKISWKPPSKDYKPNWDIFNLGAVWLKALDDALVHTGALEDDNIAFFNGFGGRFIEVETLEERRIEYIIRKI